MHFVKYSYQNDINTFSCLFFFKRVKIIFEHDKLITDLGILFIFLKKIVNNNVEFKKRAVFHELKDVNPVARCCDLTWRRVVLLLFCVYVNFSAISSTHETERTMLSASGSSRVRRK